MKQFLSIKDMSKDDKPREKLILKGKSSLSDSELLALLISTGTSGKSAIDLSREILKKCNGDLNQLSRWSIGDFCKIEGIGTAKAVLISAALELSNRKRLSQTDEKKSIKCSADAYESIKHVMVDLSYEEFWIMTLNRKNAILGMYKISEGGITSTVVDQRRIFKIALDDKSTAIMLFHNHPSGNALPSLADNELTQKIKQGGKLLDINVVDHIIVTSKSYYSYADNGLM
ncbi:MAG TPA: DNA repair protein RadC [Bacteroidia bacterium]